MHYLKFMLPLLLIMGWSACSVAQTTAPQTTLTQDNIIARKKLRVGLDTSKYWTSIVQTISAASSHRQGTTAKAVHDYCQSLLYSGGLGISVAGGVITNTGDVDPFDDITTDTEGEGDVAGFFPNLQVMGLRGVPISGTAPVTGNVYQYESGQWVPRSLGGDLSGQIQNAQIAANAVGTAEIANGSVSNSDLATVPGNTIKLRSAAGPGATTDFSLNTNTLLGMTDKIRAIGLAPEFEFSSSPLELSLSQNGAVTGNVLKWNGTDWVPDDDSVGGVPSLTQFQIGFGEKTTNVLTSDTALVWNSDSLRMGLNWSNPTAELTLKGSPNATPAGSVVLFDGNVYCECYDLGTWTEDFDEGAFVSGASGATELTFNAGIPSSGTYDMGGFMFFIGAGSVDINIGASTYTVSTTGVFSFPAVDFTGATAITLTYTGSGSAYLYAFQVGYTLPDDILSDPVIQVIDRETSQPYPQFGLVVSRTNLSLSNTLQLASGEKNIVVGRGSGVGITTGSDNTALGDSTLTAITTGSQNVAFGNGALKNATGSTNTAFGINAGSDATSSGNIFFGSNTGSVLTGSNNVFIGANSGSLATFTFSNTAIGTNSMSRRTGGSGNIALGNGALLGAVGGINTGSQNIAIGISAGLNLTEASNNILVGDNTGRALTTGFTNTIIGGGAGWNINTGYTNIFFGQQAGYSVTSGYDNTLIGRESGWTCANCYDNVFLGNGSGRNNSSGTHNNVAIGSNAGYSNTGSNNVFLGPSAGYSNTLSNTLWIDNSNTMTPLIGADFSGDRVGINTSMASAGNITSTLHITGTNGYNQLRLATSYTPTSTADTNGNTGDLAWDTNYIYIKTASGWKRSALSTF